jgi:hypothetical protein
MSFALSNQGALERLVRLRLPLEPLRTCSAYPPDEELWLEVDDARLWRIRAGSTSGMLAIRAKRERTD